jgi:hypothetical protein
MFIGHLKECGIDCKVSDLDNAKRYKFEPHTAGFTDRAAKIAHKLKKQFYNDLDLSLIFDDRYVDDCSN